MPLTRISVRRGHPPADHRALFEGVYRALRDTYDVPEGDRFMVIDEYDATRFDYGPDYMDIRRSDDLVMIHITATDRRSVAQKKALYARIVSYLGAHPGVRPEDVFITIVDVKAENWSFGHGMAQYAA